jgi:hypothetical protein
MPIVSGAQVLAFGLASLAVGGTLSVVGFLQAAMWFGHFVKILAKQVLSSQPIGGHSGCSRSLLL